MPSTLTYPGVYIEEIPSGVRTITGVSTSVAAFVGRAQRGPVNTPATIHSFGDFERQFGGLWVDSSMSFAVRDFFMNGGSQAVIVRLYHPLLLTDEDRAAATDAAREVAEAARAAAAAPADPEVVRDAATVAASAAANRNEPRHTAAQRVAQAATNAAGLSGATAESVAVAAEAAVPLAAPINRSRLAVGGLNLEAANPGTWGNQLRARVDHNVLGPGFNDLFNLSIRDGGTGEVEVIRGLAVIANHPRNVVRVLERESQLVRVRGTLPANRPSPSTPGDNPFGIASSNGVDTDGQASDGFVPEDHTYLGSESAKTGLFALEKTDLFNLLCIPPYSTTTDVSAPVWAAAAAYCERRRAMLLVDVPGGWASTGAVVSGVLGLGTNSKNACVYFPRLSQPNPLQDNHPQDFPACGAVAGVFARTDATRGVWKAPAGLDATLVGVPQLAVPLTDGEIGVLNPLGVNCLRAMPAAGRVVWGARTLQGDDRLASEWKYIPVRRLALFIEESLYRGTKWAVFEPNDEPLWAQLRLNIGAFMQNLFRQGAFQGKSPREAYFVKCDSETTTQTDINLGIVNIIVGFAPLKPAEFVVIKLQQMAGQVET